MSGNGLLYNDNYRFRMNRNGSSKNLPCFYLYRLTSDQFPYRAFWKSTNFDKYLNNNVVTINENATLEDALSCKLDRKTNVIAVIDDEGTLKGYLSKHLLLTMLSKQLISTEEKVQNNAIISAAMPQNSDSQGQVKAENSLTQEQNSRLPDINAVKEKILSAASKIKNIEVLSNTEGQKLQTQTKEKD